MTFVVLILTTLGIPLVDMVTGPLLPIVILLLPTLSVAFCTPATIDNVFAVILPLATFNDGTVNTSVVLSKVNVPLAPKLPRSLNCTALFPPAGFPPPPPPPGPHTNEPAPSVRIVYPGNPPVIVTLAISPKLARLVTSNETMLAIPVTLAFTVFKLASTFMFPPTSTSFLNLLVPELTNNEYALVIFAGPTVIGAPWI